MSDSSRTRPSARRKRRAPDKNESASPDAAVTPTFAEPEGRSESSIEEVRRPPTEPPKRPRARRRSDAPKATRAAKPKPDAKHAGASPPRKRTSRKKPAAKTTPAGQRTAETAVETTGASVTPEAVAPAPPTAAPRADAPVTNVPSAEDRENVLYDLEAAVDQLLQDADSIAGDPRARRRAAEAMTELAARLGAYAGQANRAAAKPRSRVRSAISRLGQLAIRHRSADVDAFGLDTAYETRSRPLLESLHRKWFRVRTRGIERVPPSGRVMLVANHGGILPLDALMIATSLRLEHPDARVARWLAEDFTFHMPFVGTTITRLGGVRACPENAERVLDEDGVLTVFPEGLKGVSKLYGERYALQRFGRGGYVKVALRTGAPIVPVGIVGAEEAYPLLFRSDRAARWLGVPLLPVTPLFPWLGPAGLVPLPSRFEIHFGDPIEPPAGPEGAGDALLVSRVNELVRGRVQGLLDEARRARGAAFRRDVS